MTTPRKRTPRSGVAGALHLAGQAACDQDINWMRDALKDDNPEAMFKRMLMHTEVEYRERLASLRRARDFARIVAKLSTFERDAIDAALRAREGEAS